MEDKTTHETPIAETQAVEATGSDGAQLDPSQLKERWLRAEAELDNVRKRAAREIAEYRRFAQLPLLRDLLPVADNIGRTLEAAEKAGVPDTVLQGFRLVAKQLDDEFAKYDCQRIEALHQPFDPNLHEALTQQPSADYPPGTVIMVVQPGYKLHDRVIRPARVIVATAPQ